MAEIRRDRLLETGLIFRDRRAQPRQPVEALAERRRRRRPRHLEHGMEGVLQGALPGAFQGLVHGVSRWGSLAGKLGFCASSGKSAPLGSFGSGIARFGPDKTPKSSLAGLSKAALRWYIPLAPRGIARVAFSGSLRTGSIGASGVGHSVSVFWFRFFAKARNGLA